MWRKIEDCIRKLFGLVSHRPSEDLKNKTQMTDHIVGQVKRETEKLNDRIDRLMREFVSGNQRSQNNE